jgi:hypothetical protein
VISVLEFGYGLQAGVDAAGDGWEIFAGRCFAEPSMYALFSFFGKGSSDGDTGAIGKGYCF